jgi:tripeptidyl-peptidase-2
MFSVVSIITMNFMFYCFSLQWTVQLNPKFHEDASNLEQLVPFEECLQLHSTDSSVVKIPEYIMLTNNGRSFKLVPLFCSTR